MSCIREKIEICRIAGELYRKIYEHTKGEEMNKDESAESKKKTSVTKILKVITTVIIPILGIVLGGYLIEQVRIVSGNQIEQYSQINEKISQYEMDITQRIDKVESTIINGDSNTVANTITNNNADIVNESMSEESLLLAAQNAYYAENYQQLAEIYSIHKIYNNKLVQNNMGYMYANGLYYPVNIEQADFYYDKAIANGDIKAYENKLALHFRTKQDDRIELIEQGYKLNDEKMLRFFASHFEGYENCDLDTAKNLIASFMVDTSDASKEELLEKFYTWEYKGTIFVSYGPADTEVVRFIKVGEDNYRGGTVYAYAKYCSECAGIEMLEENFEMLQ